MIGNRTWGSAKAPQVNHNDLEEMKGMDEYLRGSEAPSEQEIRPANDVARRAVCLCAVAMLGELEEADCNSSEQGRQIISLQINKLTRWLEDCGASRYLSRYERLVFQEAEESWDSYELLDRDAIQNMLGTLLWAMGLLDRLPEPGEVFPDPIHWFGGLPDSTGILLEFAVLRPQEELQDAFSYLSEIATEADEEEVISLYRGEIIEEPSWCAYLVFRNVMARAAVLAWVLGYDIDNWGEPDIGEEL
jgi:hypothetical protein